MTRPVSPPTLTTVGPLPPPVPSEREIHGRLVAVCREARLLRRLLRLCREATLIADTLHSPNGAQGVGHV